MSVDDWIPLKQVSGLEDEWMNEWVDEWVSEWLSEWMNE